MALCDRHFFLVQSFGVFTVSPPDRVSACHVEQVVSGFDGEYRVFLQERPLYRSKFDNSGSLGRSSHSKLKSHHSRTWHQRPGQPVWVPGVDLRVAGVLSGSRPVMEELRRTRRRCRLRRKSLQCVKIKGLDSDSMPRSGDVMVSVSPALGQYYRTCYSC